MRKIVICVCFILMVCAKCHAAMYYVFIDKVGKVQKGQEAGQTSDGDVVAVYPSGKDFIPTRAELSRYQIIKVNLTQDQVNQMLESEVDVQTKEIKRARKRNLKYKTFSNKKQKAEISASEILSKITVKPKLSVAQ